MRRRVPIFIAVIGRAALLATLLHGLESGLWALAYRGLGALPDGRSAMLYSLSAMTSYGHANLYLKDQWQLMGALEALKWDAAFWTDDCILIRDDPRGLGRGKSKARLHDI